MRRAALLAGALVLASAPALAHEAGHTHMDWKLQGYVGASVLHDTIEFGSINDGSVTTLSEDDSDIGHRLFAGVGFLRYFGLEAGYADYGDTERRAQSTGSGTVWAAGPLRDTQHVTGIDLSVIVRVPLARAWAVAAQFGGIDYEVESTFQGSTQNAGPADFAQTKGGTGLLYAGRFEYDGFDHLRLAAGYAQTELSTLFGGDLALESFSVSVAWRF